MLLDMRGQPANGGTVVAQNETSITRSFSMKLNLGNYESADFFCSQRAECVPDMAEEVSRDLDEFCKEQVLEAIIDFKRRRACKEAQRAGKGAT